MALSSIRQVNITLTDAEALAFYGDQVDPHGEVYFGHRAIHDFMSGLPDSISSGYSLPNLIPDGAAATAAASFTGITASEGINKASAANASVTLPLAAFDLTTYGTAPSVVIALWVTQTEVVALNQGIIGLAGSSYRQWGLVTDGAGGVKLIGFGIKGEPTSPALPLAERALLTIHLNRVSDAVSSVSLYLGAELAVQAAGTYPLVDVLTPVPAAKSMLLAIGGGFSAGFIGIAHRVEAFQVSQDFDVVAWIKTQMALMAAR